MVGRSGLICPAPSTKRRRSGPPGRRFRIWRPPGRRDCKYFLAKYERNLTRSAGRLCWRMFDMSGDELGWVLAIGFALVFAVASGAVAYYLSRAS
jgi:hypothetical protein